MGGGWGGGGVSRRCRFRRQGLEKACDWFKEGFLEDRAPGVFP